MSKAILSGLCALAVAAVVLSVNTNANAQSCGGWVSCGYYLTASLGGPCSPPLPQGAFDCVADPTIGLDCRVPTTNCPPPAAGDETCPTCGKGQAAASSPINLATGNTYIQETDVRIPGLSNGLTLVRQWNSKWPSTQVAFRVGLFGPNWRSTFEERVFLGNDHYMKYARGDGSFWSFGYSGNYTYGLAAPANAAATLVQGSTSWTLTFQNGEQRLFNNASGSLTAIIDRNGNTTQLSYDATNRLTTVTDPAGRHLYFGYANATSALVTSVTSDVGISLSYSYDIQGRLLKVTRPDQSTLNFEYDINSLITAVKDSNGKVLESHTYDSNGRGLTGAKAGGVEAVTITYPH
jgi:YD repeat-containing protein